MDIPIWFVPGGDINWDLKPGAGAGWMEPEPGWTGWTGFRAMRNARRTTILVHLEQRCLARRVGSTLEIHGECHCEDDPRLTPCICKVFAAQDVPVSMGRTASKKHERNMMLGPLQGTGPPPPCA
eukprot:gene16032-biopygen8217